MRFQHPSCTARAALRRASMTSVSWSVMPHYYQELDGFFWFEVGYRRMLQTLALDRPSVFVEIGSYQGKSTAFLGVEILNRQLPCTLHCVDAWETPNGIANGPAIHEVFERNMGAIAAGLEDRFVVHWSPSVAAAEDFPDASADVVWSMATTPTKVSPQIFWPGGR